MTALNNLVFSNKTLNNLSKSALGSKLQSLKQRLEESSSLEPKPLDGLSIIVGIPDDRGVTLNNGHAGASAGPSSFRDAFYRLQDCSLRHPITNSQTETMASSLWVDAGDIVLSDSLMETHDRLSEFVTFALKCGARRVYVIGGGHDFSFGSYSGHAAATDGLLPLVNFDAHFDLRPVVDGQINSGTPFRRVIESFADRIASGQALLELGIQRDRNPAELEQYCTLKKIPVVEYHAFAKEWRNIHTSKETTCLNHVIEHLDDCKSLGWVRANGRLHLSIDLDVLRSDLAPGTSASTPFGVTLPEIGPALTYLARMKQCRVVDIAELCPTRDILNQTARLAASLVFQLFLTREETLTHE